MLLVQSCNSLHSPSITRLLTLQIDIIRTHTDNTLHKHKTRALFSSSTQIYKARTQSVHSTLCTHNPHAPSHTPHSHITHPRHIRTHHATTAHTRSSRTNTRTLHALKPHTHSLRTHATLSFITHPRHTHSSRTLATHTRTHPPHTQ